MEDEGRREGDVEGVGGNRKNDCMHDQLTYRGQKAIQKKEHISGSRSSILFIITDSKFSIKCYHCWLNGSRRIPSLQRGKIVL